MTMARKAIGDVEVADCPIRVGEQMLLAFPAANHDPGSFENAHEFQLDRAVSRHVWFGLGVHRCLGSNPARLELTVALQEWIHAFPNYELDVDKPTAWANGRVRGPLNMPVVLNR